MKKIAVYIIPILLILMGIIIYNNINLTDKTKFKNNSATKDAQVDEFIFKNIKRNYSGGITTISADIENNSKTTKTLTIKISIEDNSEKEITNVMQIVENVKPDEISKITAGVTGDYTKNNNIKFEIVK